MDPTKKPAEMVIPLDKAGIERALPLVSEGLEKYCDIQEALATTDVSCDRSFQRLFNGFYRVQKRGAEWQSAFYGLLQKEKSGPQSFAGVLRAIYNATGRVEASFASKLAASVDPGKPVIDSIILKNLGLRLPPYGEVEARLARIVEMHALIGRVYADFLATEMGRYLTTRFEECYPGRQVTPVKMLDLVLWQTRQGGIEKARKLFQKEGLAFPSIPKALAPALKEQGKWLFSTRDLKLSPYNLDDFVHEGDGAPAEYVVVAHSGHGINSYAIQYYLVSGPLRMFLHLGWGGGYSDSKADAAKVAECFSLADQIVPAATAVGKLKAGERLTIVGSDFYGSYWSAAGRQTETRGSKGPAEVLAEALHWLQSTPPN